MHFFDEILPALQVQIKSNEGKVPLQLQGPLRPANIEVDGSLSSQFLTGLLMAYAAAGADGVTIQVKNLKSKPYIDLTLAVMADFTLQEEFGKLGIEISLQDDLMIIKGGTGIKTAKVHSHHDHRIAMACAVAGLCADGDVIIADADAINKSYPDFYDHLQQLGADIVKL